MKVANSMNIADGLKFDPGFSSCVARVSGNLEYIYSAFNSIISLKQKKFQFSIIYPKIVKIVDENIAFYLGCLLWAIYLKSFKDIPILNNPCLDASFDEDSISEINFLIDFTKTGLNRDSKYYINKPYSCSPHSIKVLEIYKDFLISNNGFISTKNTNDIVIPDCVKKVSSADIEKITKAIDYAVKNEDIMHLLPLSAIVI